MDLPQSEADALMGTPKNFVSFVDMNLAPGSDFQRDLQSADGSEEFILDVRTNAFKLTKYRYQNRARKVLILARLCIDGPAHTNPDGVSVGNTHLHTYIEGFGDKYAKDLDPAIFTDPTNRIESLRAFCTVCNIHPLPTVVDIRSLSIP
ncbi:MAG: hypothetical protein JWM55_2113 [Acidimicrobiaceae bacterium]|nr:hypothetical protein [Acidimicrobiaceae bacterium]